MHDIGNAVNRSRHAEYGAILANELLKGKDLSLEDRITIMSAIGNHDESTGGATDPVSAALIIADKTDVRRNRVRDKDRAAFDIHDRVNYAVTEAKLKINKEKKLISLNLQIDESICTMYEYFDIFLGRMMMCRGAEVDWIEDLFVLPEYQGNGYGSHAIALVEAEIKKYSESVYLEVAARNFGAMKLYHRLGYHCLNTVTLRKDFQPENFEVIRSEELLGYPLEVKKYIK